MGSAIPITLGTDFLYFSPRLVPLWLCHLVGAHLLVASQESWLEVNVFVILLIWKCFCFFSMLYTSLGREWILKVTLHCLPTFSLTLVKANLISEPPSGNLWNFFWLFYAYLFVETESCYVSPASLELLLLLCFPSAGFTSVHSWLPGLYYLEIS
jgi:hypothetical protein